MTLVNEDMVKKLASIANLPLDETRIKIIAPELEKWIHSNNELSEKMSAEDFLTVTPITIFNHPGELNKRNTDI